MRKRSVNPELAEKKIDERYTGEVKVEGMKNVVYKLAGCCRPKPGDVIVGYSSTRNGIMVHRADCLTFQRIENIEHRMVDVSWAIRELPQKKV